MDTRAVVLDQPGRLDVRTLALDAPGAGDCVVQIAYSGISTGTERLLYTGQMPEFPGMGYPLVPGYESVGRVIASHDPSRAVGDFVFVPGARCYGPVRGLFGGAAQTIVLPAARTISLPDTLGADAALMALAATAYHAVIGGNDLPELIIGHGVLGRLLARVTIALGGAPIVWEANPARCDGAMGYTVIAPEADTRRDYRAICDVSGDASLLDTLIGRLAPRGEICLAGFYKDRLSFAFPPAFMREARLRIAAEWKPADMTATADLVAHARLALAGLITHQEPATNAQAAYEIAFGDPGCLKMIIDWRTAQ